MDQLASDFAEQVQFLFVYACEAHPERFPEYPPHRSLEQKHGYARDMQQRHGTQRPILIDSLLGDAHRLYGGLSNMSWVIDHTGRITYKAAWTVVDDVRDALEDVIRIREWKREASSASLAYMDYYKETISILRRGQRTPSTRTRGEATIASDN